MASMAVVLTLSRAGRPLVFLCGFSDFSFDLCAFASRLKKYLRKKTAAKNSSSRGRARTAVMRFACYRSFGGGGRSAPKQPAARKYPSIDGFMV